MTTDPWRRNAAGWYRRLAALALLATGLTGCGDGDGPRPPAPWPAGTTVLVVGNRANSAPPVLEGPAASVVDDAIRSGDRFYLLAVSGDPTIRGPLGTTTACNTERLCGTAWRRMRADLDAEIRRTRAASAEADLLEAVARGALAARRSPGARHLVIVDSGLQTAGLLPLQGPGALAAAPAAVVASLAADRSVPDLAGIDVTFTGLGSVRPPQPRPRDADRKRLHDLWQAVLATGRPDRLEIADGGLPDATTPAADLPPVTRVAFADPAPVTPATRRPVCIVLREDQIGFRPDRAEFEDRDRARRVLRPLAAGLVATGAPVSLTGTTAYPETDPRSPGRLSLRRAEAVRAELLALHVPARQIVAVRGVGTGFDGYRDPVDARGRRIETIAVADRLVMIGVQGARC